MTKIAKDTKCKFCSFESKHSWNLLQHQNACQNRKKKVIEKDIETQSNETEYESEIIYLSTPEEKETKCPFCSCEIKNPEDLKQHQNACQKKTKGEIEKNKLKLDDPISEESNTELSLKSELMDQVNYSDISQIECISDTLDFEQDLACDFKEEMSVTENFCDIQDFEGTLKVEPELNATNQNSILGQEVYETNNLEFDEGDIIIPDLQNTSLQSPMKETEIPFEENAENPLMI